MIASSNSRLIDKMRRSLGVFSRLASIALILAAVLSSVIGLSISYSINASAAGGSTIACDDANSDFLGFPTWYRGLTCDGDGHIQIEGGQSIFQIIIVVGLNVVDIILRLVGLVALAFIIYGGIQYLIARGEPGNVAKAKSTITRAVVGLIIGIASSAIVGFITTRIN